jgi:hypothetical protein
MSKFTSTRLSVRQLLDFVPKDGCMLVFNGSYRSWLSRTQEKRLEGKMLYTAVADPAGEQKYQPRRDLYIYWR